MNDQMEYILSCIIPVYNVEQYINECIESLLKISSLSFEIILVDDGSTDSSSGILDQYAMEYASIKVIHQSNEGLSVARNRGLEEANGDYVVFIDSDDWINPIQLEAICHKAIQNNADLILGNIMYVIPGKREYSPYLPLPKSVLGCILSGCSCFVELIRYGKFVPMATSYLYRREWLRHCNLFFEPVLHEDELWSVKALCLAERVVCTDWTFYYYRQRSGSIMSTLEPDKRINSLLHIANRLLVFSGRFDTNEKRQVWSMLYYKSIQLYRLAFDLLDKMRSSNFSLNTHSLYQFYHKRNCLIPEVRLTCLSHYKIARKKLQAYHYRHALIIEVIKILELIPDEITKNLFDNSTDDNESTGFSIEKIYPEIRHVIALHQLAHSFGNSRYSKLADKLLNIIVEQISVTMPMRLGNGILGIACGIIYLSNCHYIEEDIDEALSEIDQYILIELDNYVLGTNLPWADWLYYLRLRIQLKRTAERRLYELRLRQGVVLLLDHLCNEQQKGYKLSNEEINEISVFHSLGICPFRTKDLIKKCNDICFIIPVRIDSKERERNLDFLLEQLVEIENSEIWIIEGDCQQRYILKQSYSNVNYQFKKDTNPIFHRTRYLNDVLQEVKTSIVGIWDTDVYVSDIQIQKAINAIRNKKTVLSFPYNGQFIMLSSESTNRFIAGEIEMPIVDEYSVAHSYGGAFFVNREIYLLAGGENEHFYGWGPEDRERVKRMEILGYSIFRTEGNLYHFYHPRGKNSCYIDKKLEKRNREEFLNICKMEPLELMNYISTWNDRSTVNQFINDYQADENIEI